MGRFTTAAKVGAFAFVTLLAAILIYRFVSKSARTGNGYVVYALMADASGIAKLSQVRIAGIVVGSVKSVKLDHNRARIDIGINDDVKLYQDAAVAKVASSLLGEFYLALTPGTEGRPELKDGDRINNVVEAQTTDDIMRQVSDISKDVKQVTEALAASIGTDQGREDIKTTLKNLAAVTEALNQTVGEDRESNKHILNNVERITNNGAPEVEKILENVRVTTNEVRQMMAAGQAGEPKTEGELRQRKPGAHDEESGRRDGSPGSRGGHARPFEQRRPLDQPGGRRRRRRGRLRGRHLARSDHRHDAHGLPVLIEHGEELRRASHPT